MIKYSLYSHCHILEPAELYEGLTENRIYAICVQPTAPEKLIAAGENSFYQMDLHMPSFQNEVMLPTKQTFDQLHQLIQLEPTVRDVQRAAIRYAHVGNGKIKRWHLAARARALVPDVSFSKDLDISNNIHVDTGGTNNPDSFTQGPDDRDKSTGIDFSWDLGDLLFSSSQTSIDSREKLMVELRDEILGEVTRLYFERRRLQLELLHQPPADELSQMKAWLRIEELTANLDALTDGYFSRELEKRYSHSPYWLYLFKNADV